MIKKTSVQGIISSADAGISFALSFAELSARPSISKETERPSWFVAVAVEESLRDTEKPTALRGGVCFRRADWRMK